MISVIEPGLSTTVQDTGRYGHYHIGMPPSGAMDMFAHRVANYLVGNDDDRATLEMTYTGADLQFEEDAVIAITGARMSPSINGESVESWTALQVDEGDVLSSDYATDGVRAYLSVAGGFDVPEIMGSRSTYTLIGMGGYSGRPLEEGDALHFLSGNGNEDMVGTAVPDDLVPSYSDDNTMRIIMGMCDYRLSEDGKQDFLDAEWKISDEADRIGIRLVGPDIEPMFIERDPPFGAGTDITNVVDLGYPIGSIQMAGQPIILARDAVTGGGYATIGTVISPDRYRLAQVPTNQTIRFETVDIEQALSIRSEHDEELETIRDSI